MNPHLSSLSAPPTDAIYAIAELAKKAGPKAINGTIGVVMDEGGKPLLFESIKRSLHDLGSQLTERSYSYPNLLGLPEFRDAVAGLLFPKNPPLLASIATTGGTGAVSMNLRLAMLMSPGLRAILPTPAWVNHPRLCTSAGLEVRQVPYLQNGIPTIDGIAHALRNESGPAVAILQVNCHNPTGLEFSHEQWNDVLDLIKRHDAIALLDFAYQGFGSSVEKDTIPLRLATDKGVTTLIAWSASKNHSLYSERVGLAAAVVPDDDTKKKVEGHYAILTRGFHSPSATFGQSVIALTQNNYHAEWEADLTSTRELIQKKRNLLLSALPKAFETSLRGHGLFAMLPLSVEQIHTLRKEHLVFLTDDGRINIAGIPLKRIEELAHAICSTVAG